MKHSPFGACMVKLQMLLARKAKRPTTDDAAAAAPNFMNMMRIRPQAGATADASTAATAASPLA